MAELLNLVNPEDKLSCKYEISKFPDGQQSVRIIENNYDTFENIRGQSYGIKIKSRLNDFRDLELIICATQALREIGVKTIRLYIPYCIGGRSDRKFQEGETNYIKNVISPIINSQGYEKVTIMDPHSDVLEACINNFEKVDNMRLVQDSLIKYWLGDGKIISDMSNVVFLSPDAGALKKVHKVAENFQSKYDVVVCSKHRDVNGKLSKTNVPLTEEMMDKDLFIVDDICDGGGTFINIAKILKETENFKGRIYLIVTHGIFSRGFDTLGEYFNGIYTTNSISDVVDENKLITRFNIF
jgi:ribose-phosphate pyrophosphokinase